MVETSSNLDNHLEVSDSSPDIVFERGCRVELPPGVFYNPVQQFNRDLTVAVIHEFWLQNQEERLSTQRLKRSKNKSAKGSTECPNDGEELKTAENTDDPCEEKQRLLSYREKSNFRGLRILEALSATGLRAVRMARELEALGDRVEEIVANDIDADAAKWIQRNIDSNKVGHIVTASCANAITLMSSYSAGGDIHKEKLFHVIDLDPYGSAAVFLDSAMFALTDGGLLCVTCTDTAVLCGSAEGTSWGKYGAATCRSDACHELALRVLLYAVATAAARHSRIIKPILSLFIDFYTRVYVRVYRSPAFTKVAAHKVGLLIECNSCKVYQIQPMGQPVNHIQKKNSRKKKKQISRTDCIQAESSTADRGIKSNTEADSTPVSRISVNTTIRINNVTDQCHCHFCGGSLHLAGPLWIAQLHDKDMMARLLQTLNQSSTSRVEKDVLAPYATLDRMIGMIKLAQEELPDVPFYYVVDKMTSVLHSEMPDGLTIRSAFLNSGYRVSMSHCCLNSLKTDAPAFRVWQIFCAWANQRSRCNPSIGKKRVADVGSVASRLLDGEWSKRYEEEEAYKLPVNFEHHPEARSDSSKMGLLRFPPKPEPNWGPRSRAKRLKTQSKF